MTPYWEDRWLTVYGGDARTVLADLPADSVHCCVTSPPYLGLRDYGTEPLTWGDGWVGQLGLEPTPAQYVEHLVEVFRGIRRVLRPDGIAWLVIGDSYTPQSTHGATPEVRSRGGGMNQRGRVLKDTLRPKPWGKSKDLVGIPWMSAFALRDDGWWLRADIVWSKANPMPESVEDRPTRSHESIFMLTKDPHYYYDHIAVKEPITESSRIRISQRTFATQTGGPKDYAEGTNPNRSQRRALVNFARKQDAGQQLKGDRMTGFNDRWDEEAEAEVLNGGRNRRDVWFVNTVAYPGAHYAVFPPKLVEPMILASTSERGCCPECGAPWRRVMKKRTNRPTGAAIGGDPAREDGGVRTPDPTGKGGNVLATTTEATAEFRPTCKRHEHEPEEGRWFPEPCTVLDVFAGSGTVGVVAQAHSRRAILIDMQPDYLRQQIERNVKVPLGL